MCFRLPRGLCEHINGVLRRFWWGSKDGQRKTCWVAWDDMTKLKFLGAVRDMELFNLALLARQAWRLLQEPESLSTRILKSVYYPNGEFLEATVGARPSKIWRAIIDGKEVLAQGNIHRIVTGESTKIWSTNWLPRDGLFRPCSPAATDPPRLVSELIDPTSASWDRQKLTQFFNPMDVEVICSILLSTRRQHDFWAWHYEKRGIFSVRSAYRMLVLNRERTTAWLDARPSKSDFRAEEKEWTSLWYVQVPSKIRVFLWRLARQTLPSGDLLHHRKMAPTNNCAICGAEDSGSPRYRKIY